MAGVLEGFATIGLLIALGFVLGHVGLLDLKAQQILSKLAFYVASPALLLSVLDGSEPRELFSAHLGAQVAGVVVATALAVLGERLVWRRDLAGTVMGALSASYVNTVNLGVPIAAYALGNGAATVPLLLFQLLVYQPVALALLDAAVAPRRPSLGRGLLAPLRNPLIVASLLGLVVAVTGWEMPRVLADPVDLVAGMAVPAMLIAYGISLRLGPRPGKDGALAEVGALTAVKLLVQPAAAYAVARWAFGLEGHDLLTVAVIAALPTAQNMFVLAVRYDRGVGLARDTVFATTVLAVPVIVAITAALSA